MLPTGNGCYPVLCPRLCQDVILESTSWHRPNHGRKSADNKAVRAVTRQCLILHLGPDLFSSVDSGNVTASISIYAGLELSVMLCSYFFKIEGPCLLQALSVKLDKGRRQRFQRSNEHNPKPRIISWTEHCGHLPTLSLKTWHNFEAVWVIWSYFWSAAHWPGPLQLFFVHIPLSQSDFASRSRKYIISRELRDKGICVFSWEGGCVQADWEEFLQQDFQPIRSMPFIETYFQRKCRGRKGAGFYL